MKTKSILEKVIPLGAEEPEVRRQLDRILASPGFINNERLSGFLRLVVERHLAGRHHEVKETVIAVEVFGRSPGYNPKQDAIVRIEAGRLRSRLSEYYQAVGAADPLIIELPKGGYLPAFRHRPLSIAAVVPPVPKLPRRRLAIVLASVAVASLALLGRWIHSRPAPIAIAVLPLENLNHDPAFDYLADGLTDELIRTLSSYEGLATRSRTSSFALKGRPRNIRDEGRQLAVDYFVEGSIVRSGQQLRIDAELVRVRDDVPVWSGKFNRNISNVLGVQDELSLAIVNNLRLKLGRGRRRYETSAEAYDLYLRARSSGLMEGVSFFQEAIAKDPSFAPAYAGLASAFAYRTGIANSSNERELHDLPIVARKAIELDPLLAEAYDALGMSEAREGKWVESEKAFRQAIRLDPNRSETYGDFAVYVLMQLGRIREALTQMRIAQRSDPLSGEVRSELAYVLLSSHLYDEAADVCATIPPDCKCWPAPGEVVRNECLGRARVGQGRLKEAIEVFTAGIAPGTAMGAPIRGYLGYAYGKSGNREAAERIAAAAPRAYHQALAFAGMGDRNRALAALEKMASQGPVRVGLALAVPEFDALRSDSRVAALRLAVGLPR